MDLEALRFLMLVGPAFISPLPPGLGLPGGSLGMKFSVSHNVPRKRLLKEGGDEGGEPAKPFPEPQGSVQVGQGGLGGAASPWPLLLPPLALGRHLLGAVGRSGGAIGQRGLGSGTRAPGAQSAGPASG